jgi:hypothetical protein
VATGRPARRTVRGEVRSRQSIPGGRGSRTRSRRGRRRSSRRRCSGCLDKRATGPARPASRLRGWALRQEALREAGRPCGHDDQPASRFGEHPCALERAFGRRRAVVSDNYRSEGSCSHGSAARRTLDVPRPSGRRIAGRERPLTHSSTVGRADAGSVSSDWAIARSGRSASAGRGSCMPLSVLLRYGSRKRGRRSTKSQDRSGFLVRCEVHCPRAPARHTRSTRRQSRRVDDTWQRGRLTVRR